MRISSTKRKGKVQKLQLQIGDKKAQRRLLLAKSLALIPKGCSDAYRSCLSPIIDYGLLQLPSSRTDHQA